MHPDAAVRGKGPYRLRPVRTVDRVFAAGERERARAHRIARRAARDHVGQFRIVRAHLRRRRPRRIDVLAAYPGCPGPLLVGLADRDLVAEGLAVAEHEIKSALVRLDDDCAGLSPAVEADRLARLHRSGGTG